MSRWMVLILGLAAMAVPANSQAIRVDGGLISGTTGSNPDIRVYKGVGGELLKSRSYRRLE